MFVCSDDAIMAQYCSFSCGSFQEMKDECVDEGACWALKKGADYCCESSSGKISGLVFGVFAVFALVWCLRKLCKKRRSRQATLASYAAAADVSAKERADDARLLKAQRQVLHEQQLLSAQRAQMVAQQQQLQLQQQQQQAAAYVARHDSYATQLGTPSAPTLNACVVKHRTSNPSAGESRAASPRNVHLLLREHGLSEYEGVFEKEGFTTVISARALTDQDMQEMGVAKMAHRKALLRSLSK